MVEARNSRFQVTRQPLGVGAFKHVSGFIVAAGERDVNKASHNINVGRFCDEFVNHDGTLPNLFRSATNAKRHCSDTQPEGAFI